MGSYTLNPYLRNNFRNYVESEVGYSFSQVLFGNTSNSGYTSDNGNTSNSDNISDSNIHNFNVDLKNGTRFPLLSWESNYSYIYQGQDYNGHSLALQSGYPLNRTWKLLAQGGYESYTATDIDERNGSYAEAGGAWTPNRYLAATALAGLNANTLSLH